MNHNEYLSDERLVSLHQKKRINAFFIIYKRYQNYGYAIIYRILESFKLVNALKDNRDSILYESIVNALATYEQGRGVFRKLLGAIIENQTINEAREFKKDPLSDYISIDSELNENSDFRYADSLTFADRCDGPKDHVNLEAEKSVINTNLIGVHQRRTKKMIRLREQGFTYHEIARRLRISEKSVRGVFYRLRKRVQGKECGKIKK